jgi:hypothetical protein
MLLVLMGEAMVTGLIPLFLIHNLAVFRSYHHVVWRSSEVLAYGGAILADDGNLHCVFLPLANLTLLV